jgi:hypothetical protein
VEDFGEGRATAEQLHDRFAELVDQYLPKESGMRHAEAVRQLLDASITAIWTTAAVECPVSEAQRAHILSWLEDQQRAAARLWALAVNDPPWEMARVWAIRGILHHAGWLYLGSGGAVSLMNSLEERFGRLPRPRAPFCDSQPSLFDDFTWAEFCEVFDEWWCYPSPAT